MLANVTENNDSDMARYCWLSEKKFHALIEQELNADVTIPSFPVQRIVINSVIELFDDVRAERKRLIKWAWGTRDMEAGRDGTKSSNHFNVMASHLF